MKSSLYISLTLFVALCFVSSCDDSETPPQAAATFTASKTTVEVGEEIQFTNNSQNATAFRWSFGDGTTSKDVAPKKSYPEGGTYQVSLVSTGAGGTSISNTTITVVAPEIYYIDYDAMKIRSLRLDVTNAEADILNLEERNGVGLAYDAKNGKIYYSDFEYSDESKIWRMNLDGSNAEVIVDGLYNAYQIELDVAGGKIYWADDGYVDEDGDDDVSGRIGRANLDGTNAEPDLVSKEGLGFKGIALDPENNKMYYYDDDFNEDGDYKIYVSNLDGSNEAVFLDGFWGYALTVDTVHDKIYFDNQGEGLYMADLDGTNVTLVSESESYIYGIIIDDKHSKVLWTERDAGTINRANLNGTNKEVLKTGIGRPRGLILKN